MKITARPARKGESAAILAIHRRAIHEIACADYSEDILQAWGPPIPEPDLPGTGAAFDAKIDRGEIVLVADLNGSIAGFGEIVPARNELLAIYVSPDFKRRGVGTAILRELERIARERAMPHLQMDASLTAEPFYSKNGYRVIERGFHVLRNGVKMACVKMKKELA
jgi:putative acetyltransferase